jgi:hypothetical protein
MKHQCDLQKNQKRIQFYEDQISKMDICFLKASLSKPALRSLVNHGIFTPAQFLKMQITAIQSWHGIGPIALKKLMKLQKSLKNKKGF